MLEKVRGCGLRMKWRTESRSLELDVGGSLVGFIVVSASEVRFNQAEKVDFCDEWCELRG